LCVLKLAPPLFAGDHSVLDATESLNLDGSKGTRSRDNLISFAFRFLNMR